MTSGHQKRVCLGGLLKEDYPQGQANFAVRNLLLEEKLCKIYSRGDAFQIHKKFTYVTSFALDRYAQQFWNLVSTLHPVANWVILVTRGENAGLAEFGEEVHWWDNGWRGVDKRHGADQP